MVLSPPNKLLKTDLPASSSLPAIFRMACFSPGVAPRIVLSYATKLAVAPVSGHKSTKKAGQPVAEVWEFVPAGVGFFPGQFRTRLAPVWTFSDRARGLPALESKSSASALFPPLQGARLGWPRRKLIHHLSSLARAE